MDIDELERKAICCVLLDMVNAMEIKADIKDCRHYQSLIDKMGITDPDFEAARTASVLSSLVVLKGMHYNRKMLLALVACDLLSVYKYVPLNLRLAFETMMNAIEWPISFSEIQTMNRTK